MEPILNFFAETYYSVIFLMICQIIAAIVSYYHRAKFDSLKHLHWYPIASFLQGVFTCATMYFFNIETAIVFIDVSIDIFVLFEVLLIYIFFTKVIAGNKLRIVLKSSLIGFFLYLITLGINEDRFFLDSSKIIMGESCMVILAVCAYLFQLFLVPPTRNLTEQPTFWVSIGILIAFSSTLPAVALKSSGDTFIISYSYYQLINFIGYSILFLLLTRAYLCKKNRFLIDADYVYG